MRVLKSSHLFTGSSPSNLSFFVWLSHQVIAWTSIPVVWMRYFSLPRSDECWNKLPVAATSGSASKCRSRHGMTWYRLLIPFWTGIDLGHSKWVDIFRFLWFFVSPQSFDPCSDFSSAFEPPSSLKNTRLLLRAAMRRFTLWFISATCCSSHENLTFVGSRGSFTDLSPMIRVLWFSTPLIYIPTISTK